ncbi:hypothetical protein ACFFJY_02440 [Fictibacillus aquaticus]|uniref:Uncharacterized protein n=1 Tax=Fictibacillus aquaticus TaxID=2021314 RepID=A0A235F972_9BACL|nr:hypothetical protein [Fictibacillus aquaticus]OYD57563.1 hypothetical protein CGZ90_12910 [Fictibacillus aquaticus]
MMEKKLSNLNSILNDEMSTEKVFTAKDEAAVLRKIEELRYAKIKPKRKSYAPQVLTAAVVAGIAFAGYEVMNYEKAPNSAEKKEVKEQFAAPNEQFSEPKGTVTYDPDTKTLDVKGSVVNKSQHAGVPFKMKLALKNPSIAEAAGVPEVLVDVPKGEMRAGDPFRFASSIPLDAEIDPTALENGIEVVFYNDESVLSSYIISDLVVNEAAAPKATAINVETLSEVNGDEDTQLNVQVTFEKNNSAEIVYVMNDENYRKNVTFEVRDENVVTVSEDGVVEAVENPTADETVIIVKYQDETGEVLEFEVPVKLAESEVDEGKAAEARQYFEGLTWGMSKEKFRKIVPNAVAKNHPDYYSMKTDSFTHFNFAKGDSSISYIFKENKLAKISISFNTNENYDTETSRYDAEDQFSQLYLFLYKIFDPDKKNLNIPDYSFAPNPWNISGTEVKVHFYVNLEKPETPEHDAYTTIEIVGQSDGQPILK